MKASHKVKSLAMSLIIAISCTGCGGCGTTEDSTEVNADNVVVESTVEVEDPETVEEEQADMGSEETPTPAPETTPTPTPEVSKVEINTSLADIYYIIIEDQNVYASPDITSEVLEVYPIDTEITVSGIHEESGMFEVVDANGDIIGYVDSGFCDLNKGGYQVDEETAIPDEDTTASTEDTQQGIQPPTQEEAQATLPSSFAGEPWYEALTPAEKAQVDNALQNSLDGTASSGSTWADQYNQGSDTPSGDRVIEDSTLGDGSGLQTGVIVE
ncbi:MAG: hypothetical protein J6B90_08700 [Lachnospiraceae bacterium]|nr:hypothetical protein [Lachnospiraceae bacterium]